MYWWWRGAEECLLQLGVAEAKRERKSALLAQRRWNSLAEAVLGLRENEVENYVNAVLEGERWPAGIKVQHSRWCI